LSSYYPNKHGHGHFSEKKGGSVLGGQFYEGKKQRPTSLLSKYVKGPNIRLIFGGEISYRAI
jgi:hypothetical protein